MWLALSERLLRSWSLTFCATGVQLVSEVQTIGQKESQARRGFEPSGLSLSASFLPRSFLTSNNIATTRVEAWLDETSLAERHGRLPHFLR